MSNLDLSNKNLMIPSYEFLRQKSQLQMVKEKLLYSQNKIKILNKRLERCKCNTVDNNEDTITENFTNINKIKSSNNILFIFLILFILFIFYKFKKN